MGVLVKMAAIRLKITVLLFISAILLGIGFYFIYPVVSTLKKENPKKTSFMEYREEEWEREGKKIKIRQIWIPYSSISPYLVKAVLIAEDDKFWSHEGFDFDAGGSTISQQLAKNLYLTPSKNPLRKVKEAILTWRIERTLSKKRILELYLNVAEWGEGIFGIEAASRHYYGKPASDLTPEEAARLASVLPNPRRYKPVGDSKYVGNRSRIIYNIMVKRGIVITESGDIESKE
ncbi:MAG: Biosynthetic peptidoglycan transglycosylase [Deltaproteobacteria bacterium]|nr:Biosynthetic peptidoglycan transglycosylase [Deltaproteobacteria bacterium]